MGAARQYRGVPTSERQRARRDRLVDAALTVIADSGASALTVNRVCSTAGLNPRYYYEHFTTLDDLFRSVAEHAGGLVVSTLVDTLAHTGASPVERAETVITAGIGLLVDDPRLRRLVVESATHPVLVLAREDLKKALLVLIIDQHPERPHQSGNTDEVAAFAANILLGGLLEVIGAWTTGNLAMSTDEIVARCVEVTLLLVDLTVAG